MIINRNLFQEKGAGLNSKMFIRLKYGGIVK